MKEQIKKYIHFLTKEIMSGGSQDGQNSLLYNLIKIIVLSVKFCTKRRLLVQASALSYYSFFAVIPILAFIFAVAKGFGMDEHITQSVVSALSDGTNSANIQLIFSFVDSYLKHAKGGIFVGVGILFLAWSVYNVFLQIEKSFNEIWGVTKGRSISRRLADYFSITLIIPFLIIVSSGLNVYLSNVIHTTNSDLTVSILKFILYIKPWLISCCICLFIYMFIPYTKVNFVNALCSGLLAGCAVIIFKEIYLWSLKWITSYNAIYGSLAAVLILLLFLRILWIIILSGVEISYAAQNIKKFEFEEESREVSPQYECFICLYILYTIIKRFEEGEKDNYSFHELVTELKLPIRIAAQCLEKLVKANLLQENLSIYSLKVDINKISLAYFISKMQNNGMSNFLKSNEIMDSIMRKVNESESKFIDDNKNTLIKDIFNKK